MNKPRSLVRSKSDDTGRNVQSRIARYIRGEISANMISTNSNKVDASNQSTNTTIPHAVPAASQTSRHGLLANKLRSKIRPPFRNTVNVKSTNFSSSSLAMAYMDVKGTSLVADSMMNESAIPEIDTICLCQSEAIRKFVPEPGSYMLTLARKLTALQNRNASN